MRISIRMAGGGYLGRGVGSAWWFRRIPAEARARIARETRLYLQDVIRGIQTRQGDYFTNPTGALARSMYARMTRMAGGGISGKLYWGVPYGPALEWPWKKRKVVIKPRNAKVLRFVWRGEVVYLKRVTQYYTRARLRPHVKPEARRQWPGYKMRVKRVVKEAIRG